MRADLHDMSYRNERGASEREEAKENSKERERATRKVRQGKFLPPGQKKVKTNRRRNDDVIPRSGRFSFD